MTALWLIVLCGALAVVYAIWAMSSVMKADAGNARMQEIAAAVAEGAQAYLKRQYATIAIVGVVIFLIVGYFLGWLVAGRFRGRRDPVGSSRLHRHERLGTRQRPYRAGGDEVARRRSGNRIQGRRHHRHAGCGSRAARRDDVASAT